MNTYFKINFHGIYEYARLNKIVFVGRVKNFLTPNNFKKTKNYFFYIKKIMPRYSLFFKTLLKFRFKKKNRTSFSLLHSRKKARTLLHFKKNFLFFFFKFNSFSYLLSLVKNNINFSQLSVWFLRTFTRTFGEGFLYIRGLFLIFFIDASFSDDEPLWEPIEWSLFQTWLLFIFIFAWIAENLITSRFGSYTGRDKRVWFGWYKTFWLIELWYAVCYGVAAMFVIVPFYYELTYGVSFIFSWWNWYNRVFFFKFISIYTIVLLIAHLFQINIKWMNWKKLFFFCLIINFFILYLLYTHFVITFFGYFTDPLWYQKTRIIDYVQLSHEPQKWGWGPAKRDHFTYHKSSTVFWFKNDGPFAGAFLMINMFFFLSIFFLYIYWLILLRRIYATKEITYTFATFCVSSLKQFYCFFFLFYILIFISFIICYWRFPVEFFWLINSSSWIVHFFWILVSYPNFLLNI